MWINVMNLLWILGVSLGLMITVIAIRAYFKDKDSWSEIETKAGQSGIHGFSE